MRTKWIAAFAAATCLLAVPVEARADDGDVSAVERARTVLASASTLGRYAPPVAVDAVIFARARPEPTAVVRVLPRVTIQHDAAYLCLTGIF